MASLDCIEFHDGNKAPWLAYGTGTAIALHAQDVTDTILLAIKSGFRHLDGAQVYQNEHRLGKAVQVSGIPRSEFFISTKLFTLQNGETVTDSLKGSLEKLGMDYVDLFLLHIPAKLPDLKAAWLGMVEAKKAGLVKSIGVSNFNIRQLEEIMSTNTEKPVVNQIEMHLFLYDKMKSQLEFHEKHNIVTMTYAGLTPLIPERIKTPELQKHRNELLQLVDGIRAARGEVTQNQILMKWSQQKGFLTVSTSFKESRLKEYLSVQDLKPLTDEEIIAIDECCKGVELRAFPRVWSA